MPQHHDYETYCELSLFAVGAFAYSQHPSCDVLLLSWGENDIQTWEPHLDPFIPDELLALYEDPSVLFYAHNAMFEYCIHRYVMRRRYGAPAIAPSRYRCTAAMCAAAGLPRALDKVGAVLELATQKSKEGTKLIQLFCRPQPYKKPTKAVPEGVPEHRVYPKDRPEEWKQFRLYNRTDVKTEMLLLDQVPPLSAKEQIFYEHDLRMNARGMPIDMDVVRAAMPTLTVLENRTIKRVMRLSGGVRPTQRDRMLETFADMGLDLENLQAKTLKDILTLRGDDLDPELKELLMLRLEGGKASTKKLKKMLQVACEDGRVRGAFLFNGAVPTMRLAGKLIQPQNFTRGEYSPEQLEDLFWLLQHEDADTLEFLYERPIDSIAQGMRGFIVPGEGKKFVVCDFSAIEARVVAWLADEKPVVEAYRQNKDMYVRRAASLYGRPEAEILSEYKNPNLPGHVLSTNQRKFAKDIELGCFSADTIVLTKAGSKWIVDVLPTDLVWDGVEWVSTAGPTYMGEKVVINFYGVKITPDHQILVNDYWHQVGNLKYKGELPAERVYDLIECGPRHRFTILTDAGPLIVHNCCYQMGGPGFYQNCIKRGINVKEEFCIKAVKVYRRGVPAIVKFWYDTEACAIAAVQNHATQDRPIVLRHLRFLMDGRWLCIRLPSGRLMRYIDPKVEEVMRFGRKRPQLSYKSEFKGKWIRETTYGGKLVENITQAVARDIMVESQVRAEREGYPCVGTVHDELITEVPIDFGSAAALREIMIVPPKWAIGAPINAAGWESKLRYRKG